MADEPRESDDPDQNEPTPTQQPVQQSTADWLDQLEEKHELYAG